MNHRPRSGFDQYPIVQPMPFLEAAIVYPVHGDWTVEASVAYHSGRIVLEICPYTQQIIRGYRRKETYEPAYPLS